MGRLRTIKIVAGGGLSLAGQSHETWFEAWAIYNLGYLNSLMGRYAEGYERMIDCLNNWRVLGDPQSIALGLNFLVPTLNKLGRFDEAKTLMLESIALCEQSKNRWGLGTAYRYLGLANMAAGECKQAQVHLKKSLEAQLSSEQFSTCLSKAKGATLDAIVKETLDSGWEPNPTRY